MFDDSHGFVTRSFLRAEFELDYRAYVGDGIDEALLKRLTEWDKRLRLSEVQAGTPTELLSAGLFSSCSAPQNNLPIEVAIRF